MTAQRSETQGLREVRGLRVGGQYRVGLGVSLKGAASTGGKTCAERTAGRCLHLRPQGSYNRVPEEKAAAIA